MTDDQRIVWNRVALVVMILALAALKYTDVGVVNW